jgi:hypothetical protein
VRPRGSPRTDPRSGRASPAASRVARNPRVAGCRNRRHGRWLKARGGGSRRPAPTSSTPARKPATTDSAPAAAATAPAPPSRSSLVASCDMLCIGETLLRARRQLRSKGRLSVAGRAPHLGCFTSEHLVGAVVDREAVLPCGLVFLAVLAERFLGFRLGRWQSFGVTITATGPGRHRSYGRRDRSTAALFTGGADPRGGRGPRDRRNAPGDPSPPARPTPRGRDRCSAWPPERCSASLMSPSSPPSASTCLSRTGTTMQCRPRARPR